MSKLNSRCYFLFTFFFLLLAATRLQAAPVDVNTADAETLAQALTGIGAKTAAAIVAHRKEHGRFTVPEDLLKVKGIGPKLLERNKQDILIGNGNTGKAAGKR